MHVKKQHTPIQIPWKELLGETNQSQKSSENLTLNTETFKYPPLTDIGKTKFPD
jgi:hypothetical protein